MDHIILGSSDMNQSGACSAKIKGKKMAPILYKMIHTGKHPKLMEKKINKMKDKEPERYQQMQEFLHSFMVPAIQNVVMKKSIYNQYVSDLITKIDDHIEKKELLYMCFML